MLAGRQIICQTFQVAVLLRLCTLPTGISCTLLNQAESLRLKLMNGGNKEELVLLFFIEIVLHRTTEYWMQPESRYCTA